MSRWFVFTAVLGLLILPGRLFAQPVITSPYSVDFFATEQGLPGHQIYDIAQTADGYLWVATNGGLARFDGYRFLDVTPRITPALESPIATDLYVGRGDTLFASAIGGPQRGSHVIRYVNGTLDYYGKPTAPFGNLGNITQGADGRLIATTDNQLLSVSPSQTELLVPHSPQPFIIRKLATDVSGTVWAVISPPTTTIGLGMASWCGSEYEPPWSLGRIGPEGITQVAASPYPYILRHPSRQEVLRSRLDATGLTLSSIAGEPRGRFLLPELACPILLDRDGVLWVQEGTTIAAYAPDRTAALVRLDLELSLGGTPFAFEDREGVLWFRSTTQGLIRVRRNPFQVYTATDVADQALAFLFPGDAGTVLLYNSAYGVHRASRSGIVPVRTGTEDLQAQGVYEDGAGGRLYAYTESEVTRVFNSTVGPGRPLFEFRSQGGRNLVGFYPDPHQDDTVWLYLGEFVYRITAPMSAEPVFTQVLDGLTSIRHLLIDQDRVLWAATEDGVVRFDGGSQTRFGTDDGLPHPHIRSVHQDPDGVLWAGTYGGGLARYKDGRFQAVTEDDGLAENVVSTILEDASGHFWMSGNRGIHRTARADLNAFLDGELDRVSSVLYGRESGLVNPENSGGPAIASPDGRFWFPTFFGAAVVDPARAVRLGTEPPLVHAEAVWVEDAALENTGAPIRLAANQRRFSIAYVGLSLRHPEAVRYRYRLDGFDPGWIEAGTERQAGYTNVPPGEYTFRVQAQSFTGVWSEDDGVLALSVAPYFYETLWFYLLGLLAVLGLMAAGYGFRVRQLKAREAELAALVQARTEDLEREKETVAAQAEALRSLDEAKSRVFANISHEFRTPLTLILGPLEDLEDGLHGSLPERAKRSVAAAISNGRRLLRLVNQLLDVSRLESGRIDLQARRLDAGAFVEHLAQTFTPYAERKHLTFRVHVPEQPVMAYLDPEQFEKVLANLLGNAFKFTPDGGTITVTLRTDEEEAADHPGTLVLTVQDDGPGIAPEHLPHVFERFYQVDASTTRRQPGTGIGLALVHNLVALHGGTIAAQSDVDAGATFTVRVPLGRAHLTDEDIVEDDGLKPQDGASTGDGLPPVLFDEIRVDAPPATHTDPDGDPSTATTVLIVDDNPEIRAYVRSHLAQRYRILEAADGREALTLTRAHLPDLIVSDVMMPELDGFGFCQAVKADPELDFIPVILLTARASTDSKLEGLQTGADDYLTKPFDVRELEVRVENLIASRQRLKARYASHVPSGDGDGHAGEPRMESEADLLVQQVRGIIDARLSDEGFGVDALAAAVGMGRTTLYQRLGEALGQTPMELIWTMRLERAAALLRQQQGTVSEVAYGVGFKSVAHFCNRFREAYDATPASFAARHNENA